MTEQEKKELQERVKSVIERVNNAAVQAGRDPSEITLVAATKMNDAERVQAAIEAGIRVCGENRVQELQEKYEQNAYDGADLQFIGTLQTNKVQVPDRQGFADSVGRLGSSRRGYRQGS